MARQEDFQSKWISLFWFNNGALLAKVYPKKAMFDTLEADIVILQETKIQRKDLTDDMVLVPGWDCYFSLPRHEKGKGPHPI